MLFNSYYLIRFVLFDSYRYLVCCTVEKLINKTFKFLQRILIRTFFFIPLINIFLLVGAWSKFSYIFWSGSETLVFAKFCPDTSISTFQLLRQLIAYQDSSYRIRKLKSFVEFFSINIFILQNQLFLLEVDFLVCKKLGKDFAFFSGEISGQEHHVSPNQISIFLNTLAILVMKISFLQT